MARTVGLRATLLGLLGATAVLVVVVVDDGPPRPSAAAVELRLRALSARADFPLHDARCLREDSLPHRFVCLVEGPDDLHLAWHVRWLNDGRLDVRRPDGTPVRF